MSRSSRYYRKEVKNFKRENQRKAMLEGFIDLMFMFCGISIIAGVLLYVLNSWNY